MSGEGIEILVRLASAEAAALDEWAGRQEKPVERPEAVRQLIAMALSDRRQRPRAPD